MTDTRTMNTNKGTEDSMNALKNFTVASDYVKNSTTMCGRCSWAKDVCRCEASETLIEQADRQLAAFRNRRALDSHMKREAQPRLDAIAALDREIAEEQARVHLTFRTLDMLERLDHKPEDFPNESDLDDAEGQGR
jgi:hypothetical protein